MSAPVRVRAARHVIAQAWPAACSGNPVAEVAQALEDAGLLQSPDVAARLVEADRLCRRAYGRARRLWRVNRRLRERVAVLEQRGTPPLDGGRQPVTGPFRVYVDRGSTGVSLDVSHLVGVLLLQLARDFEEDPSGVGDVLETIAGLDRAARGSDSHAGHERDARVQELLDGLGGGGVPVVGGQVLALAERLLKLAQELDLKPVQRVGGGEAA